jgi:hypothetical protein
MAYGAPARTLQVINPFTHSQQLANPESARRVVERLQHQAAIAPQDTWKAFAVAEIELALDAASKVLQ